MANRFWVAGGLSVCAAALLAVGAGCAISSSPVVRSYDGTRSPSEIAVVLNPSNVSVSSVNEKHVSKNLQFGSGRGVSRIELEPGTNRIVVAKQVPKDVLTGTTYSAVRPYRVIEIKLKMVAVAGGRYELVEEEQKQPEYFWTCKIIDSATGKLMAPLPPEPTNAPAATPPAAPENIFPRRR